MVLSDRPNLKAILFAFMPLANISSILRPISGVIFWFGGVVGAETRNGDDGVSTVFGFMGIASASGLILSYT